MKYYFHCFLVFTVIYLIFRVPVKFQIKVPREVASRKRRGRGIFEELLEVGNTKLGELRLSGGQTILFRGHLPNSIAGLPPVGKFVEEFCVAIPFLQPDCSASESP